MNIPVVSTLARAWQGRNRRVRLFFVLAALFLAACAGTALLGRSGVLGAGAAGTAGTLLGALAAACLAAICTFQGIVERVAAGAAKR